MNTKRLRFVLFAVPLVAMAALTVAADGSHPAGGGVIDATTCVSVAPCIEYDNNGTGPAIRGVALKGNGISGSTHLNSTSATNARAGVLGKDDSGSGTFNSGVSGLSVRGTGVLGNSTNGIGVQATSSNFIGALVTGGLVSGGINYPALSIVQAPLAGGVGGADLIDACKPSSFTSLCYNGIAYFIVDGSGNITTQGGIFTIGSAFVNGGVTVGTATRPASGSIDISGQYLKNNTCVAGCTTAATTPGKAVVSYAAQESAPTIEDFGEAQLVNGQAYVRLSSDFANTIEQHANYLVVITPEGPSRGLYVTQKTPTGFVVMENPGGHATIAFSYRIMAKPYGVSATRLPMVTLMPNQARLPMPRPLHR